MKYLLTWTLGCMNKCWYLTAWDGNRLGFVFTPSNYLISACFAIFNQRLLAAVLIPPFMAETWQISLEKKNSCHLISPSFNYRFDSILWKTFNHVFFRDISTSKDVVCWSNKVDFCCLSLISETKRMSPALLFSPLWLGSVLLLLSSGPIMQPVLSHWTTHCFSSQYHCVRDCVHLCKCVCM